MKLFSLFGITVFVVASCSPAESFPKYMIPQNSMYDPIVKDTIVNTYANPSNIPAFTRDTSVTYKIFRTRLTPRSTPNSDIVIDATVEWADFWKQNLNAVLFFRMESADTIRLLHASTTELSHPQEWMLVDIDHDGAQEVAITIDSSGNGYTDRWFSLVKFDEKKAVTVFREALSYSMAASLYENTIDFVPVPGGPDRIQMEITLANADCNIADGTGCQGGRTLRPSFEWTEDSYSLVRGPAADAYQHDYLPIREQRYERD